MSKAHYQAAAVVAAVALVFGAGAYAGVTRLSSGAASNTPFSTTSPEDVDLSQFWKAWDVLEEDYVPTAGTSSIPSEEERVWGAIAGLVESYGDPYTVFLPPQEAEDFAEEISGAFEGVGMEVGVRDGGLVVISPLKNTPAERAGIRSGDKILSIDKTPAERLPVDEAVKLIRGPKGSVVTITVAREGEAQPLRIPITRSVIEIPTINYFEREDGVFVIELYNFSGLSVDRFRGALREFALSRKTKLILDLRGNPGGYLEAAVEMASYFLPVGAPIVIEDFDGKRDNVTHRSRGYDVFRNYPLKMAILINGGSASASEILAGALSEHDVAVLVGEKTFGKGSVQQLVELGGGAELKITIARWLTPGGISISEGGLTPEIGATVTQEDTDAGRDPQREAAVRYLLSQ